MPTAKIDFRDALAERIMLCDGALGTRLYEKGISTARPYDELNLTLPDQVLEVHREYVAAGADIIETNTFGATPIKLAAHGLEKKAREINIAAVKLAREAAGDQVYVAGAIGPIGKTLKPVGMLDPQEARFAYREQIEALLEAGVDLFIIETMSDLNKMQLVLSTIRGLSDIPVIAQMAFTEEGKTLLGDKPEEAARRLPELGADVVGANCSVGPQGLLDVLEKMGSVTDTYLSAQPNAGMPKNVAGRCLYLSTPEYMADYARRFVDLGVNVLGGCCGTTPDHITALKNVAQTVRPRKDRTVRVFVADVEEETEKQTLSTDAPVVATTSRFRERLGNAFFASVELDPPKGIDPSKLLDGALKLKQAGIDTVNVADSPLARARMSPLALSHLISENVGIEIVLHMSCRDRNILGLQSELIGAHALGIRNILAVTGDPPNMGDYPHATGVFDVDAIGLVHLIRHLNRGLDLMGRSVDAPTDFTVGVAVNPTATDLGIEMERFDRKVEAGAEFAFTQPLYNLSILENFMRADEKHAIPIFVGILPLRNAKHAEFLHNEVPEMVIPQAVRDRMRNAGDRGMAEGVRISQEFLKAAREMVQGVYLMPPFNRFEMAIDVVQVL